MHCPRALGENGSVSVQGKNIIVTVTGGIAAYKAADLVSRLVKRGARVRVAMTESAKKFVAPLTYESICGHPVYESLFETPTSHEMEHIGWARWADAIVVAPATASFMAKMAHGLADDAAMTLYLAFDGPTWVAPAMNTKMWEHPATQANVSMLVERGVRTIGPDSGSLACGEVGEGRMAEPEQIVQALERELEGSGRSKNESGSQIGAAVPSKGPLSGRKVLITAGPTREALDPIRFLSNRSTGRMGRALAEAARERGAEVVLIHGPMAGPVPEGVEAIPAETAAAMLAAVQDRFSSCSVAIFAAAVSNYRLAEVNGHKIKGGETLELNLVRTPDIAAWAGNNRSNGGQLVVGFAAESENLIDAARDKLNKKSLDLIFANPIGVPGIGFEAESNSVTLISQDADPVESGRMTKSEIADWIWERISERMPAGA